MFDSERFDEFWQLAVQTKTSVVMTVNFLRCFTHYRERLSFCFDRILDLLDDVLW
jgi:hypothetical protein